MSRVSVQDAEVLAELRGRLVDTGFASVGLIAAPAAQTSGTIAVTYTTDDPAITGDGLLTVADGDAVTIAENYIGFEECLDQIANLVADMTAMRTALNTITQDGADGVTLPAALTGRATTLTVTYTANPRTVTIDQAETIADGDVVVDEEYHDIIVEIAAELTLVYADFSRLHNAISILINQGVANAPVLAVRTSTNGGVVITYTTDDPAYTPDGSFTVADGDLMTSINGTSFIEELINDSDFLGDDFTAMKTAYDLYLDAAARPTS